MDSKIPIVDPREMKIAGVRVRGGFQGLARDSRAQAEVEEALAKLPQINFEYWIKRPDGKKEEGVYMRCCIAISLQFLSLMFYVCYFLLAMLKRGKSNEEVHESRRRVFLNQHIMNNKEVNKRIEWSPDNISFLKGDIETTVTEHYRDAYGIQLVSVIVFIFCHYLQLGSSHLIYYGFRLIHRTPIYQLCTLEGRDGSHFSLLTRHLQRP